MPDLECDVCGQPAVGVASSCLGAISFAFCKKCLEQRAEPIGMLHFTYDEVSRDGEGLSPWVKELQTYHNGEYITWDEFVQWRKDNGRKKSEPAPYPGDDCFCSDSDSGTDSGRELSEMFDDFFAPTCETPLGDASVCDDDGNKTDGTGFSD